MTDQTQRQGTLDPTFEETFRTHYARICWFFVMHGVRREEAHDETIKVFMSLHQRWPGVNHALPIAPWLRGIARNHLMHYWRTLVRRPLTLTDEIDEQRSDDSTPEHQAQTRQQLRLVRRVIESLPFEEADVFVATVILEESVAEYARRTEVNEDTARSRLARAVQAIKRHSERPELKGGRR